MVERAGALRTRRRAAGKSCVPRGAAATEHSSPKAGQRPHEVRRRAHQSRLCAHGLLCRTFRVVCGESYVPYRKSYVLCRKFYVLYRKFYVLCRKIDICCRDFFEGLVGLHGVCGCSRGRGTRTEKSRAKVGVPLRGMGVQGVMGGVRRGYFMNLCVRWPLGLSIFTR